MAGLGWYPCGRLQLRLLSVSNWIWGSTKSPLERPHMITSNPSESGVSLKLASVKRRDLECV